MLEIKTSDSYWVKLAESYALLGSPLRPSRGEIEIMERVLSSHIGTGLKALLLGVTPDLVGMQWPRIESLIAIDQSLPMIEALWQVQSDPDKQRWAICGDWSALPLRARSCGFVTGDGSLNCVRYPDNIRSVAASLRCVLRDDGIAVLRCYTQPEEPEDPDGVFEDLRRGLFPTFHEFKFRLLMAMQRSTESGVCVAAVYEEWHRRGIDPVALTGWDFRTVQTMEHYRGKDTVHTFPSLSEWRELLLEFFEEPEFLYGDHRMAQRCPIVVLKPRGSS